MGEIAYNLVQRMDESKLVLVTNFLGVVVSQSQYVPQSQLQMLWVEERTLLPLGERHLPKTSTRIY